MSAATVDITNIDTSKVTETDNMDAYQRMAFVSSTNMFVCAEKALDEHPNLEKVTVMEYAPRYDTKDVDPLNLKPALAKVANNALAQLWLNSKRKNKIQIGQHSLPTCDSGAIHDQMFRNTDKSKYDGVHFFGYLGRRSFSKSVSNIMQKVSDVHRPENGSKQPQEENQRKSKNTRYSPPVKVSNRFDVFNSNLGNL